MSLTVEHSSKGDFFPQQNLAWLIPMGALQKSTKRKMWQMLNLSEDTNSDKVVIALSRRKSKA